MNGTIRLPALVANEVFEVSGEGLDRQLAVGGKFFVVRVVDGDDIAVRREQVPTVQLLDPVGGFLLKRGLHLLRHHTTAEDPGERVTHGSLELPLETLNYPHRNLLTVPVGRAFCPRCAAAVTRHVRVAPLPCVDPTVLSLPRAMTRVYALA